MPLQYPQSSPYNPYTEPKSPANWPLIILITLGVIILILAVIFVIIPYFSEQIGTGDNNNNNNGEGIAVGEFNPSAYDCSKNVYNCGNFTTQAEAQVIFDACFKTAGDIHGLDKDGNGKACEGLE